jgi:hypothetical protein
METLTQYADVILAFCTLLGAILAIFTRIWRQGRKMDTMSIKVEECSSKCLKIDELDHRLTVMETRFEPFLKIIEDSIGRLFPKNPLDVELIRRIRSGEASVDEIHHADEMLKHELNEGSIDPFKLIMIRYWLALKEQELTKK